MSPWVPPTLETERLSIRPLHVTDLAAVQNYVTSYSAERYGIWLGGTDPDSVARYIADTVARYGRPPRCDLGITIRGRDIPNLPAGQLIGGIAFRQVWINPPAMELGWVIHPSASGNGLAGEAISALKEHLLETWPTLVRLEARVLASHEGAKKLLERQGFEAEGILRSGVGEDGHPADGVLYSCLRRTH